MSDWKDNPIFQKMDPRKKRILEQLADNGRGRSAKQAMPLLMAAMSELKKQNLTFTPEESSVLISVLSADLSPAERQKVEKMRHIMNNRK